MRHRENPENLLNNLKHREDMVKHMREVLAGVESGTVDMAIVVAVSGDELMARWSMTNGALCEVIARLADKAINCACGDPACEIMEFKQIVAMGAAIVKGEKIGNG